MQKRSNVHLNINPLEMVLEKPEFQRTLNNEHKMKIYNKAIEYLNVGDCIPFPLICVAFYPVLIGGVSVYKYYIIDGQHRYEAYKLLKQNGYNFTIDVQVITCANSYEAEELYKLSNQRMEHSLTELYNHNIQNDLDREIQNYLYTHEAYFTVSKAGKRPKIKAEIFYDKWIQSSIRPTIKSISEFESYLINMNNKFKHHLYSLNVNEISRYELTESLFKKATEINWFLGLDKTLSWLI